MSDIQTRMQAIMRRAFFDKLREDLAQESPDAGQWLVRLHAELAQRLAALRPRRAAEISDKMDNGMFARKVAAKAFRKEDMRGMVDFAYELLREIVAPDMDERLRSHYVRTMTAINAPNPLFSEAVPEFLDGAHALLDETMQRIERLRQRH